MKKPLIFLLVFSLLTISACSLKPAEKKTDTKGNPSLVNQNPQSKGPDLPQTVNNESRLVAKDAFSLEAPANWKESPAMMPGISLMMINSTEKNDRPEVKKINFRSYFSVSYDTLKENTLEQYIVILKEKLSRTITGIRFQDLEPTIIDGRPAKVFSADLNQQGVDFKILMFVAEGNNKDVWMIPFNTLPEDLSGYNDLFYKIATSFRIK